MLDCGIFSLLAPLFAPSIGLPVFPSCHSIISVVVPFEPRLLGHLSGLLYALFSINDPVLLLGSCSCYFGAFWPITLLVGSFGSFLSPQASLAHFLSLDILEPFLTLCSHGLLLIFLGFSGPITISFFLGVHELSINPLLFLLHYFGLVVAHSYFSISHNTHGFITSFSGFL